MQRAIRNAQSLEHAPGQVVSVLSTSAQPAFAAPHDILQQGVYGAAVRTLQANLAALGYTDSRGQPLQPDGHFGRNTEAAVRAFQSDHGLLVDGIVGKNTLEALHGQRRLRHGISALAPESEGRAHARFDDRINHAHAQRDPRAGVLPEVNTQISNPFADPRHPDHGMYAELKERIPDASENRLAELTAACHMVGIKPGQLGDIHIGRQGIVVRPDGFGLHAVVDNSVPAPPIQQTVQQVQAFDIQQAQLSVQLNQAQVGPVMGGPGSYGR
ncbi:peptidoglycan-binding protein [Dyella humi]|uniref:Peptidoglycan-binding protein n=1 Tax=Dyella humi TaxID=1770547 RepID=A0ABW8IFN0_9GAMM